MIQISRSLQKASTLMLVIFLSSLLSPGIEAVKAAAEETTTSSATSSSGPAYEPGTEMELSPNDRLHPEIDNFSGALTYAYDLVLPPGRSGLQPDLSLNYSSLDSKNDSIFGYGWSLSIPSIERINRKGSDTLYDSLLFSSSLSGELVSSDGENFSAKTERGAYLNYVFNDDQWAVTDKNGTTYTFGETAASRQDDPSDATHIFKWMLSEIRDVNDNFISYSYSKDSGQIYPSEITYTGNGSTEGDFLVQFNLVDSDETVSDYSNAFSVQRDSIVDSIVIKKGTDELRRYDFSYTVGHNQHRVVLSGISETATDSEGTSITLPETSFTYQATDDSWQLDEDWTMPFYEASGSKYAYDLYYEAYTDHPSTYTDLIDVNGDALLDYVVMGNGTITKTPSVDQWYRVYLNTGSSWELADDWMMPTFWTGTSYYSYELSSENTGMMDVNGDGLPDFVAMDDGFTWNDPSTDYYYRVFLNTGSSWELAEDWKMPLDCGSCTSSSLPMIGYKFFSANTKMIDINGDHLPDFVVMDSVLATTDPVHYPGFYDVFLNTGSGWEIDPSWGMPEYINGTDLLTYDASSTISQIIDINGDELPDFVVLQNTALTGNPEYDPFNRVFINTGSAWELDPEWTIPYFYADARNYSYDLSSGSTGLLDVNGDGLPDFVVMQKTESASVTSTPIYDYQYRVYINTGSAWALDENWHMPVYCETCSSNAGFGYSSSTTGFMDVNGDELPDFVNMDQSEVTSSYPSAYDVYLNTGSGWWKDETWELPIYNPSAGYYLSYDLFSKRTDVKDINADGLPDFIVMQGGDSLTVSGSPESDTNYRVFFNMGKMADRLESISQSSGSSIEITYREQPILDRNPFKKTPAIYVVSDLISDDGLGATQTVHYDYADGKFYFHEEQYKSFTGFGAVTKTSSSGRKTITYNHQGNANDTAHAEVGDDVSKIGLPYRTDVYDGEDQLFSSTVDTWESTDLGDDRTFVAKTAEVTLTYDGLSSHRDRAVEYTYDEDGNVETVVNYGEVDADEDGSFTDVSSTDEKSTTTYSYAVDSSGVIRNKVSEQKITNDSGLTLQKTRYFYDSLSYGSVSTGNLTREAQWQSAGDTWMNTDYSYDAYGLVSSVKNPRGFTTSYTYDAAHLYPEVSSNPKGFTVTRSYDYATGKITSQTDENGYTSETTYDGLGRVLTISVPDPSTGTLTELSSTSYDDDSVPNSISTTTTISGVTSESVTYLDGFGRTVETNTLAEDGQYSTVDTWYDEQGNVAQQTLPYFSSSSTFGRDESAESTVTTYDVLNRPTLVTTPTGSTSYDYSLWATTVTDPNGNDKVYSYSAAGQLVQVEEENTSAVYSTVYHYNPLGQLVQLTDDQGSVRHFHYDTLGRKVSQEDLHAASETSFGTWTYIYDSNNNLVSQTDPKGQTITWAYDQLDRPTYEDWDSSTTPHEILYFYDTAPHGKMKLAQVKSNFNDFVVTYTGYDALGNLSSEIHSTKKPGLSTYYDYSFQTSYDLLSRPTKVVYPGGALTVNTVYNATGQVEKVTRGPTGGTNVIADMDYNAAGQITSMAYANGVTTTNVYDAAESYRLGSKISTGVYSGTSGNIQDLTYAYDDNGNITGVVDASITPTNKTLTYTYDDLNRLLTASSSGFAVGDYSESYSYDSVGNLTSKSDVGSLTYSGTGASSGSYSGANPHAVTGVGTSTYTYDLNGNLTGDGTHTYSWDKRNHLSASGTLSYSYDNTGSRYKTVDTSSGTPSFNYYVSRYEELRGGTGTTPGTPTYYIFAGSQRVATFESGNFYYILEDHLGGTSLVTNSAGAVDQIYDYFPYGSEAMNTRLGTNDVRHSFTDKELEDTLGLYYFEARWYKPSIGRFIGQDPMQYIYDPKAKTGVTSLLGNPQALNYYSYASNNPVNLTDPTGMLSEGGSWWNPFDWNSWDDASYAASKTLETLPVTGDVCDIYSLATGETPFSQEPVSNVDKGIVLVASILPVVTGGEAKAIKNGVETLIKNATEMEGGGLLSQWGKNGGFDQALKDFEEFIGGAPITTHELPDGHIVKSVELPDGSTASVRNFSSEGSSTLQINNSDGSKVKIRYNESN